MKTASKRGRASLVQKGATTAAKLIKISPTQDLVERAERLLAGISHYRLPDGPEATKVLDLCEIFDGIRTILRAKAKALLLKEPGAIPGYHVAESPQRRLSPDTAKVFDALSGSFLMDMEEFLAACSTSLTAVRNLLARHNPHLSPDEIEHALSRALVDVIHYEKTTRLSRTKGKQIELSS